jgi:hypothetical protein
VNGKDYVAKAVELGEQLIAKIKESGMLDSNDLLEKAAKACQDLDQVKNKATLRTKHGSNMAFPAMDTAEKLEEAVEDDDPDDIQERLEEFISAAETLVAGLKDRTVIMT